MCIHLAARGCRCVTYAHQSNPPAVLGALQPYYYQSHIASWPSPRSRIQPPPVYTWDQPNGFGPTGELAGCPGSAAEHPRQSCWLRPHQVPVLSTCATVYTVLQHLLAAAAATSCGPHGPGGHRCNDGVWRQDAPYACSARHTTARTAHTCRSTGRSSSEPYSGTKMHGAGVRTWLHTWL